MGRRAIWVCLVLAVAATTAWGETLRVPKDYESIQDAIDDASAGDVVKVSKGTYTEALRIEKNLVKDCLNEAYRLRSGGNDIIRNKAKKCGTDVADSFPAQNHYEKNSFPAPE